MKHEIEIPEGMQFDAENSIIKFKPVPPKKTPEQMFQDMWDGCTIYLDPEDPYSVCYMKNGKLWFRLDIKSNTLWCNYTYVWGVLENQKTWNYNTTQFFIKNQVEERFKMIGVIPIN